MPARRLLGNLDPVLLACVAALVGLGLLGVASATVDEPSREGLWRVQGLWALVGLGAATLVCLVDYRVWLGFALALHGTVVALLVAVLLVGKEVGGNRSWLLLGPMRVQPSELAKWTCCLVLAAYLARRVREKLGIREMAEMGVLAGVPFLLVALQPDMGTALIFVPIYLGAVLLGGVPWRLAGGLALLGVLLAPVAWMQLADYQRERILSVFDENRDPAGIGYQARQSKIAIGSGGLWGKGLFQGTQSRLNFLPAQHTDFVLAVIAEELGFSGAAAVLLLLYGLARRCIRAARLAQDRAGTYLCLLVAIWLVAQAAINVGMVLGWLPTIGVPLPFLSYGGSALVSAACGVGLVLNVYSRRFVNV